MKKLTNLYDCEPAQYVRPLNGDDRVAFFQRFCNEQPNVVAFLTKNGTCYEAYQTWTALSVLLAQKFWWNYIANNISLPPVTMEILERHYAVNKAFVESEAAAARSSGMEALHKVCKGRPQETLRYFGLASLFDATQSRMIGPDDEREDPELVRDQNHVHALIGAVLEAFEEVGIEADEPAKQ